MSNNDASPKRPWQEIASDAAHEFNSEKLIALSKQLARALDQQSKIPPAAADLESDKKVDDKSPNRAA